MAAASTPDEKAGLRKIEKSSSGNGKRACRRTNRKPAAAVTSKAALNTAEDGLALAASLIAITSADSAANARTDDSKSHGREPSPATFGATSSVPMKAAITTGTLIRKTDPHQKCSSSNPPMIGPMAAPTIEMEPHMAIAMLRSRSTVKVMRIRANVAGIMADAPMARKARAAISTSGVGENAATMDAMPNRTRPARNIVRWPMRSPSVPAPSSRPAMTSG